MIRIGIIDDDALLRSDLEKRLSGAEGIAVVMVAPGGHEALAWLDQAGPGDLPEVCLMDIEMTPVNGIETTRLVKTKYPDIEIIILTVFDDDDKIFDSLKAGASGYLLKDETDAHILEAIREVHLGGGRLSPSIAYKTIRYLKEVEAPAASPSKLTDRELEILELITKGKSYPQIADTLFISYETVKKHAKNILKKLQVENKVSATRLALENRWFGKK